jgi:uncharacterized repeat protein (TIGR03803 family)
MGKLSSVKIAGITFLFFFAAAITAPAQITILHSFDSTDGQFPEALVQATNGSLYATTFEAGANGFGTAFKITTAGTFTLLNSFDAAGGEYPYGLPLVQAPNGDLYGTLQAGGYDLTLCGGSGCGTAFKMTPSGKLTVLYNFCSLSDCTDGSTPYTGLTLATDGNFYGTTSAGWTGCVAGVNCGTVFKLTPSGTLTTLYSFCMQTNCTDGASPYAGLIQATDGSFYGTTHAGGANCIATGGCGTLFKITSTGALTTLYSFCAQSGCTDGNSPKWLMQATDGDIYGSTTLGGSSTACTGGCGTIFKITPSGTFATVYSFDNTDGANPSPPLQATDGNFYGTGHRGGAYSEGTIYKLTPTGRLTTLYNFCAQSGCADGSIPTGLLQDTNGKFYGSTYEGGSSSNCTDGCGTVYSFSVGLKPFVETQTTSGPVGATVKVLGTNLTGATGVAFNGTAAVFMVTSSSLITATVPAGATSGFVTVTIPSGTLQSNVEFRVRP